MIETVSIKNYKSILDQKIGLGRVNVFIGANGVGKSNILEAVAMCAANRGGFLIEIKDLLSKGVRVARPELTLSSFYGKRLNSAIAIELSFSDEKRVRYDISAQQLENIYSAWETEITYFLGHSMWVKVNGKGDKQEDEEVLKVLRVTERYKEELEFVSRFLIYSLNTSALRGLVQESAESPLGIYGEGLDVLINHLREDELCLLKEMAHQGIAWMEDIFCDREDLYRLGGYKLGRSMSRLYFQDKYMQKKNSFFSAENVNEGALYLLFYLTLFISRQTPSFFAIDNIETGLNPRLCRFLMKQLAMLAAENQKQALITTHNPAILDGLNLNDDSQRLFVVSRKDDGQTKVERVRLKPQKEGEHFLLSELWQRGFLGGLPDNF